jgi:hypothetical protein
MHHEIGYKFPNGKEEIKTVDFIQYGDTNGYTAMAKTVGLPTAIAARMVLESMFSRKKHFFLFKNNFIQNFQRKFKLPEWFYQCLETSTSPF